MHHPPTILPLTWWADILQLLCYKLIKKKPPSATGSDLCQQQHQFMVFYTSPISRKKVKTQSITRRALITILANRVGKQICNKCILYYFLNSETVPHKCNLIRRPPAKASTYTSTVLFRRVQVNSNNAWTQYNGHFVKVAWVQLHFMVDTVLNILWLAYTWALLALHKGLHKWTTPKSSNDIEIRR